MEVSKSQFFYTVPVTEALPGETAIYRRKGFEDKLYDTLEDGSKTIQDIIIKNFNEVPDLEVLGRRVVQEDGSLDNKITWETHADLKKLATALGSGILNLGLTEEKAQFRDYKLRFIGIHSINSREWFITDTANSLYNFVTMPLYDTLGEEAMVFMYNQTELSTVFLTANHVVKTANLIKEGKTQFLKNLVVTDAHNLTQEIRDAAAGEGVTLYTFDDIIKAGEETLQEYAEVRPQDILCFSYTSGTTGLPKGAMISHENIVAMVAGTKEITLIQEGWTHISYLPMPHIYERCAWALVLKWRAKAAVFNGNPKRLVEDLQIIKPDFLFSVPRLYNKFTEAIKGGFAQLPAEKKAFVDKAIEVKLQNLREKNEIAHAQFDEPVFGKVKQMFGGKLKYLVTGSAPISKDVHEFFTIALSAPLAEGYGQTECCAAQFSQDAEDGGTGYVGGPNTHLEFKLIDVPEMNYFSTDKDEQGRPAPRGEILSRSKSVIACYYKNEEKTSETKDADGWLHSGDIGTILPENGALKIIDRRKNIFKLSIGEYVAPDRLQELYKTLPGISDIFVTGDTLKSYIVGVVYSEEPELKRVAKSLGVEGSYDELCKSQTIIDHFLKIIEEKQKAENLKSFEKVKKLKISPESFEELELLTTTFKIKRLVAREHFKSVVEALYKEDAQ